MKVALIIPTHFDEQSVIAGAERYAFELAKAMARRAETRLITFGERAEERRIDGLMVRYHKPLGYLGGVVNPIAVGFLPELANVDVIHCLQFRTLVTELAILYGRWRGKAVFVTDLAGGVAYNLSSVLPVWKGIRAFLPISNYNREFHAGVPVPRRVIYGGVDTDRFRPGSAPRRDRVLFVGRLMPHKGIEYLLEGLAPTFVLDVVGQAGDAAYADQLKAQAVGKPVVFHPPIDDAALIAMYQTARLVAVPSTSDGGYTTALEAMACGTPVVATSVGSLPELVADGRTGLIVPPHDARALGQTIAHLMDHPEEAARLGRAARDHVLQRFTWDAVVDRCLAAYSAA